METFVCKIDNFGNPELVAILLKISDTGGDLKFWVLINNGLNHYFSLFDYYEEPTQPKFRKH